MLNLHNKEMQQSIYLQTALIQSLRDQVNLLEQRIIQ